MSKRHYLCMKNNRVPISAFLVLTDMKHNSLDIHKHNIIFKKKLFIVKTISSITDFIFILKVYHIIFR